MHSERCKSGSARGHAKLLVARSVRRACPTQPYIPTWAGFGYLAVVLDVFSRKVVGRPTDSLVSDLHVLGLHPTIEKWYGEEEVATTSFPPERWGDFFRLLDRYENGSSALCWAKVAGLPSS